jgi:hypothetical protein
MNVLWNEVNTRLMSPKLWKGFAPPIGNAFPTTASGNPAIGLFDDFNAVGFCGALYGTTAASLSSNGINYLAYVDGDAALATTTGIWAAVPSTTPSASANGPGVLAMAPDNDAGDAIVLQAGGGTMMPFNVIAASAKDLVFETRFKVSSIVASSTNLFIGLGGTGAAANNGVRADTSGVLASNNFLGFSRNGTATSGLTFSIQRVSGTEQEHADVGTLVADTYIKAGFRWNQKTADCDVFIDGEKVHTVTKAQCAATPWPTLWMNFIAEMKYAGTSAHDLYIDWWACAQYL